MPKRIAVPAGQGESRGFGEPGLNVAIGDPKRERAPRRRHEPLGREIEGPFTTVGVAIPPIERPSQRPDQIAASVDLLLLPFGRQSAEQEVLMAVCAPTPMPSSRSSLTPRYG